MVAALAVLPSRPQPRLRLARLASHIVVGASSAAGPQPGHPLASPCSGGVAAAAPASGSADGGSGGMLAGIRVIELATVVAAPTACAYFADMGADVIKIEAPDAPDMSRGWGAADDPTQTACPDLHQELKEKKGGGGSAYVQINRGKRSILLDVQKPLGVAVLKKLLASADVFVTNVRLKGLQKLGLDYESLAHEFPRLVYAHFTAFGRGGPKVNDPGYDYAAWWAHTGIMDLVRSSEDADMPRFPAGMGDNSTAVQLAGYIGLALFHRERTGRGQLVDASLFRSGLTALAHPLSQFAGGGAWGTSQGQLHIRSSAKVGERRTQVMNGVYRCKDGVYVQLVGEYLKQHIPKTLAALELSMVDVFGSEKPKWRDTDWARATKIAEGVIASRTFDEWVPIFRKHDVWHVKVKRFEDMFGDEQAWASGIFAQVPGLRHPLLKSPVQLSADKAEPKRSAPGFGQHTSAVLEELGYSQEERDQLRRDGVVR